MASSTLSEPASVSRPRANGTRDARQACTADLPNAVAIRPILLVLPSLVSRYCCGSMARNSRPHPAILQRDHGGAASAERSVLCGCAYGMSVMACKRHAGGIGSTMIAEILALWRASVFPCCLISPATGAANNAFV
jgi:hypothetical protein